MSFVFRKEGNYCLQLLIFLRAQVDLVLVLPEQDLMLWPQLN